MIQQRILVVEDEKLIRLACEEILRDMGFEVDLAPDGKKGYQLLQENEYDLALIDRFMPEMGGFDLIKKIKAKDQNLIAILMTGLATIESAVEAVKAGAYDYLPKPFIPDKLRAIVSRGLEHRKVLLEAQELRREREQNLLEIANERSRMQTIINCMGEGLIATNLKGQLVLINPIARKMLKMSGVCQIGSSVNNCLNNQELIELITTILSREKIETDLISKQIVFNEENFIIYLCTIAPIMEESGDVLGLVVLLRDISEEKKVEKTKAEFIRMVVHEVKAPLGAIEGYLNLILEGMLDSDPDRQLQTIKKSRDKARGLQQMIRDLLDFSAIEAGSIARHMEPLDIRDILVELIDLMKVEATPNNISITLDIPPLVPKIRGDKDDLMRLFTNLISNAIKYNTQDGQVIIQVSVEGLFLVVGVHDTGIGISEKEQQQIFDEFYRAKNNFTRKIAGTGLGLSIAKKIAEAHFGYIGINSRLGKGSTFSVYLPLLSSGIH
jgi:signal transduction histidine kinase